ncbi:MAG TPA: SpoIVB peptidase S55 domain-containing protein [Terriglobales bacterium]|nr:SpoIVB peptidase S55 domain-containing protein [Terriglobales bacterium]
MKKISVRLVLPLVLTFTLLGSASQTSVGRDATAMKAKIIPLEQIHAGMRGVAYTVFQGVKPEPMDVEVLGVMKNVNGPKGDIILVRLHGTKPEYTGVVAGMSGSPVYFDGKLAGALAFRIGEFSKEPIAGVTPIQEMLEIGELDTREAAGMPGSGKTANVVSKTSGPGSSSGTSSYTNYLTPIDTPLVFNGFTEEAFRRFAPQFQAAGIVPVMGAGSFSDAKQPEPIEAGSSISAVLVRGDMNIAATCTVTYADASHLLACGHPLMQFGRIDLPMNKAQVLATLPSPANAFKIVNTTEAVGSFVQDRHTGIMGVFGRKPDMIPVTLSIHGISRPKEFHYEVLNNSKISPMAMMATVFSALQGVNEYGEGTTYRMQGTIKVNGYPDVALRDMFAPVDGGQPTGVLIALSLGERFGRIFDNSYEVPEIRGVDLSFDLVNERRSARLESARTDMTEARPGDEIVVETVLRPYRGERMVRQIPVRVPTSTPKGALRILVSDGDTLDRMRHGGMGIGRQFDLGSTVAMLNKEHSNDRLYVSLLEANPEAMVQDKVMPTMPLSVMNVMDGMRGTQDMVVLGESAVDEASTPLDYEVAGAQVITLTIK